MSDNVPIRSWFLFAMVSVVAACGEGHGANENASSVIDPPEQCESGRPDCSVARDFPQQSDLTAENSAGLRYSSGAGSLVVDRLSPLPDSDGDGVPDDADDCDGPGWREPCDGDPTNDGVYGTVFYDSSGAGEATSMALANTIADIPKIDVYFLIDATPTLTDEIVALKADILTIIAGIRAQFSDAQFGVGLYREYPLDPLADPYSQAPFHHILDLTDDEILVQRAVSTLNTVDNNSAASAATQALYSIANGKGLGDFVPNRGACPIGAEANIGYPCFRSGALHVVMNITDSQVHNGPDPLGPRYGDPPFALGVGVGVKTLPPVEMFPALYEAPASGDPPFGDNAATALDLGDLSTRSLTLMGMSTLLSDEVNTAAAPGCASPPDPDEDEEDPPGADMDGKDVVLKLRFDSSVLGASASANNTHWPGANVALFDSSLLDPLDPALALECDGGTVGVGAWGSISWTPTLAQQYYLVADGIIPASDPAHTPEGAFSISIVHDGDPAPNDTWLTTDAPVAWSVPDATDTVESALLASDIRVASVVTLRDAMAMSSDGNTDARLMAAATSALTKDGGEWVKELLSDTGVGLGQAVTDTIKLAKAESVYTISVEALDNEDTGFDERAFVQDLNYAFCAEGETTKTCEGGADNSCERCDIGAALEYEVVLSNSSIVPTAASQVFDFELEVRADDAVDVERIPVRVMVPDANAHEFNETSGVNFYQNTYDTTVRCAALYDAPRWGNFTWEGSTPPGTSIEFQIRTANSTADLESATPVLVTVPTDTTDSTFNLTELLIANAQPWGLPYLRITAMLGPSSSPPATPTLSGWSFEFFCEPAQ